MECRVGEEGMPEGSGEGLVAAKLQGDAGVSQQCPPGYSKLGFHSRGWKWELLARLWFTFWLKQTEGPFSAWRARTCFCPGREGGLFFWVCQDALAIHGVLQFLSRTQQSVLPQRSFYSFPALFLQPNWGIPQWLPIWTNKRELKLVACRRRLRWLASLHESLSSVFLRCISL